QRFARPPRRSLAEDGQTAVPGAHDRRVGPIAPSAAHHPRSRPVTTLGRIVEFYRLQAELLWKWRPGRWALVRRSTIALIVGVVSLALTVAIVPGFRIDGFGTLVLAVVAIALINALIRPVVIGLFISVSTLAVIVVTLLFQIAIFFLVQWL